VAIHSASPFGIVIEREQPADLGNAFELVAGAIRRRDRREHDLVEEGRHDVARLVTRGNGTIRKARSMPPSWRGGRYHGAGHTRRMPP
jgi:hypothetical protein